MTMFAVSLPAYLRSTSMNLTTDPGAASLANISGISPAMRDILPLKARQASNGGERVDLYSMSAGVTLTCGSRRSEEASEAARAYHQCPCATPDADRASLSTWPSHGTTFLVFSKNYAWRRQWVYMPWFLRLRLPKPSRCWRVSRSRHHAGNAPWTGLPSSELVKQ